MPSIGPLVEKYWPLVTSSAGSIFVYHYAPDAFVAKAAQDLPNVLISVGAIAIGFLATIRSILLSASDREFIKRLREKRPAQYKLFTQFIDRAITSSFLLVIVSSALVVWEITPPLTQWSRIVLSSWIFLASHAAAAAYRSLYLNAKLLTYIDSQG